MTTNNERCAECDRRARFMASDPEMYRGEDARCESCRSEDAAPSPAAPADATSDLEALSACNNCGALKFDAVNEQGGCAECDEHTEWIPPADATASEVVRELPPSVVQYGLSLDKAAIDKLKAECENIEPPPPNPIHDALGCFNAIRFVAKDIEDARRMAETGHEELKAAAPPDPAVEGKDTLTRDLPDEPGLWWYQDVPECDDIIDGMSVLGRWVRFRVQFFEGEPWTIHSTGDNPARMKACRGRWSRAIPASSLAALKAECERLEAENNDYIIGSQYVAKRLTELGAHLGLSGEAFKNFGWGQVQSEISAAQATLAEQQKTIADLRLRLLSAAGDDLCRLSQEEIKELSSGAVKIPPKEEFLASCERFHAQIAAGPGVLSGCLTLAQLIAENERLTRELGEAIGPWNRQLDTILGLVPSDMRQHSHGVVECVQRLKQDWERLLNENHLMRHGHIDAIPNPEPRSEA